MTEQEINALNEAYRSRTREIQTRVTFAPSFETMSFGASAPNFNYNYLNFMGDREYLVNGIRKCAIKKECDTIPVGCSASSSIEITLYGEEHAAHQNLFKVGCIMAPEIGIMDENEEFMWVPMGVYRITECKKKVPNIFIISGYDMMYFLTKKPRFVKPSTDTNAYYLFETMSVNYSYNNLIANCDSTTLDQLYNIPITPGDADVLNTCKTEREAVGYIAGKVGKYAHFVSYLENDGTSVSTALRLSGLNDMPLTTVNMNYNSDPEYRIDFTGDTDRITIGDISVGTNEFFAHSSFTIASNATYCFDNPLITSMMLAQPIVANIEQQIANSIPKDNKGYTWGEYETGELKTSGNPLWDIGRILYFYDNYGTLHRVLICGVEFDMGAHLNMTITSNEPQTEFTI